MRIIDMHCDTLLECYLKNERLRKNSLYVDLESMRKNQAMVQFFAAFIPSGEAASEDGLRKTPFTLFQEMAELYENEMNSNSDIIGPALSYSDIVENNRNNKMSSVLTVEDGQLLENKPERLELLYDKGVRLITLTWDYENCLGFPHSSYPDDNGKGLKPFGIEVVERMNRLGMIVDVSHLSEGGFYDVARYSNKPFVASHSCAKTLCNHSRNLTDRQLKCIAEAGGVVGVNFNAPFLRENANETFTKDIITHIKHMVSVMGSEHVALGSDFDGIDCRLEIENYDYLGELVSELEKVFSVETLERICYKNVLRVLRDCL